MSIKINSLDGVTLKTQGKYVTEDLSVGLLEKDKSAIRSGKFLDDVEILGHKGTIQTFNEDDFENGAKEENTLKALLDYTKSARDMFYYNTSITDLTGYINYSDTENVKSMMYMFYNCNNLKKVPQFDMGKNTDFSYMYYGCYVLPKIDISRYSAATSTSSSMCAYCYSLKAVIIREFNPYSYSLNSNAFTNCYHILGIKNTKYNPEGLKDGYIYVPRDMIETLSSATNWSTFADRFRALEDYTKDGTITGEFDDEKAGLL